MAPPHAPEPYDRRHRPFGLYVYPKIVVRIALFFTLAAAACGQRVSTAVDGGDPGDGDSDGADYDGGDAGDPGDGPDPGDAVLDCQSCHGMDGSPAPPLDTQGRSDTSLASVGAHRSHLRGGPRFRTGQCTDCHTVPQNNDDPGHIDPSPAELNWGQVARADGSLTLYDGDRCTVYCHGETLSGGANTNPRWTVVGNGPPCGSCHGVPPPPPHPVTGFACGGCHPFDGLAPADPERHVDGILDVSASCTSCHGDPATGPAPPEDTHGGSDTALTGVGAHASHLAPSDWHAPLACSECHLVPGGVGQAGHIDGDGVAEVTFGGRATSDGAAANWDGAECSAYCHGATLSGGSNTTPVWTAVGSGQAACGSCHGLPPGGGHPSGTECWLCHGAVVEQGLAFVDPSLHINGVVDADAACGACHELPPPSGAHLTHAALAEPVYGGLGTAADLASPSGYAYGCGQCHPRDSTRHMNGGLAEVELYDPSAPAGSLKAQHPANASYAAGPIVLTDDFGRPYTLGTCSNVYCHSGISTSTGVVAAPGWDFPFTGYPVTYPAYTVTRAREYGVVGFGDGPRACGDCHGYPPRGSSPVVNAAAGESHAYLRADGYEDLHVFNHGFEPIACRTCHNATVQEVSAWTRDAMGVTTLSDVAIASYSRHGDGTIDVAFDVTNGFVYNGSGGPRSMDLASAAYSAATRTCSNVACHHQQSAVTFGTPYRSENSAECNVCHRY